MTDTVENLVLEHLRSLRADMAGLREDVREIKHRQNDMAQSLAGLRGWQANDAATVAHVEARVDRLQEDLERIKRRLDIAE